jgi:D-serine deaminase-like pyridoxal phosphate-dependent protein
MSLAAQIGLLATAVGAQIKSLLYANPVGDATAARTLTNADNDTVIEFSYAGAVSVTVPTSLHAGFQCTLVAIGATTVIGVAAGSGALVKTSASLVHSNGQYAVLGLYQTATANTYVLYGDRA